MVEALIDRWWRLHPGNGRRDAVQLEVQLEVQLPVRPTPARRTTG